MFILADCILLQQDRIGILKTPKFHLNWFNGFGVKKKGNEQTNRLSYGRILNISGIFVAHGIRQSGGLKLVKIPTLGIRRDKFDLNRE